MQKENKSGQVLRDTVILAVLLLGGNILSSSFGESGSEGDPGWTWLNPCPFLLLPALLGGRYGFKAGIIGAIAACGCIIAAEYWIGQGNLSYLLSDRTFLFISTIIVAVIAGELHRYLKSKRDGIEEANEALLLRTQNLERSLEVSREAQHILQQHLALQGAELCSFDLELRRLFDPDAGPVLPATLDILNSFTGITDAAFYAVDQRKGILKLEARLGSKDALPDSLPLEEAGIARAAIEAGKMITCKEIWKDTPNLEKCYLAALPWKNDDDQIVRLLLVHRMPFISVNWQNFARISLVCDWVSSLNEAKAASTGQQAAIEVRQEKMDELVDMAANAAAKQGLPSTVILITSALMGSMNTEELKSVVVPHLRSSDLFTIETGESASLSILLPMEGDRDAEILTDSILAAVPDGKDVLRMKRVTLSGPDSIGELTLWRG